MIGQCSLENMSMTKCSKTQYCAYCNLLAAIEETQHLLNKVLHRLE